ncbi:hypothetical protein [Maribacter dokdonensis]|uniref:hypothetical protein n=1 Tax=Maribacter dokdonensis TaxID=320912 RepID=UPI000A6E609E|nr:hypothetical protein [Maribacter dokdonensis]
MLNKAIDEQTELIKSDASPAYIQQADNIGNYIGAQTGLNEVIDQGSNYLNIAKGIYAGYSDQISNAFEEIKNAKEGTEGLSAAQKAGTVTTNVLSGSLKLLKVAFAATGIGLVVLALISLVSYFSKTQKGADELSAVMEGFGAIMDVLIDRVSAFGGALVKMLSGDISGGIDDIKNSLSGLGAELIAEAKAAYELEKAFQAIEDREISLIEVNARRKKDIAERKLLAKDESKTTKERVKLIEEAGAIERASLADELEIARERARISAARLALGESTRDDIRANAEAQAAVLELEERSLGIQESLESERQGLLSRARSEAAAIAKQRLDDQISAYNTDLEIFKLVNQEKAENNIETLEEIKARELELIQTKVDNGLIKEREGVLERLKIENEFLEGKAEIENAELERIQEFEDRKKALEDEIKLAKATTEREAEELRIEQEYNAHLLELETLQLREEEKTALLLLLEEQKKIAFDELDAQYTAEAVERRKEQVEAEKQLEEQRIAQREASFDAIANLAGAETGIAEAALIAKQLLALKEQAIDIGLFTSKANLKLSETTVDIASGTAKSASAAPFPANLPLIAGFVASVAGIAGTIKSAISSGKSSAESLPTAARGMLLSGARHSAGGIRIEAEDGEAVINRNSTAKYLPLLSAINQDGGGIPLAEDGFLAGDVSGSSAGLIDYDLLASKIATANENLPNPVVDVREVLNTAKRVEVVENSKEF